MKATVKVNAKTATKAETKATPTVEVPAQVKAQLTVTASADKTAAVAATKRDESIIDLGKTVRSTMGKLDRKAVQAALKPLFVEAYAKQGRDELYAGQQLSRTLQVAYASDVQTKAIAEVLTLKSKGEKIKIDGKERKINVNDVYAVASGGLTLKGEKLIKSKKDNRGGKNQKTPAESFALAVGNAVTSAKTSRMKLDSMAVAVVESFTANEFALEDVREAFEDALQD